MSWRASGYVKGLIEGLTQGEKLVMLVLADYYSDEEEAAWPSLKRLASEVLMTVEGVRRVRRSLIEKGLIMVKRRPRSDGSFQSSLVSFPQMVNVIVGRGTPNPSKGVLPIVGSDEPSIEPSGGGSDDLRSSSSSAKSTLTVDQCREFYTTLHPGLSSPIRAPARYFQTLTRNGDVPPACNITHVLDVCLQIQQAFTQDFPEESPRRKERYQVPTPDLLPGLDQAWTTIYRWSPSRHSIRIALMQFVRYDDDKLPPEIEPHTILSRIARRPDLFDRAVENQGREL